MPADKTPYVKPNDELVELVELAAAARYDPHPMMSGPTTTARKQAPKIAAAVFERLAAAGWQLAPPNSRVYGPDDVDDLAQKFCNLGLSPHWAGELALLVCEGDDD